MKTKLAPRLFCFCILHFAFGFCALAQGTAFTYQGRLNEGLNPANGTYDLRFIVYDSSAGGSQQGPILTNSATAVSNGLFTVTLDFGSQFPGANRWLEIAVRTNGSSSFFPLSPRQALTPAPYAVTAGNIVSGGIASGTYGNAVTFNNAGNSFSGSGAGLTGLNASQLTSGTVPDARLAANVPRTNQVWLIGGNAGTSTDFIGTTDSQPFDVRVNNVRVMRYRLNTDASGTYSNAPNVIGGSSVNSAPTTVVGATIAGGGGNDVYGSSFPNKVNANFGTVGGGFDNTISGDHATVGGGSHNTASAAAATVVGGDLNTASGILATVVGGSHSTASGLYATAAGGTYNIASGDYSFAAGNSAQARHDGSFVWADNNISTFPSTTANQFRVRATGGAAFVTAIDAGGAATAGVHLLSGDTAWSSISDKNAKKNFQPVDCEAVLERLASIPVEKWNYKWETDTNTPNLGPMAQDFKAAFYPGRDDKSISTLEFDGVELAAIQGLNQKLETRSRQLAEENARLRQKNDFLEKRLEALEQIVLKQKPR